MHVFLKDRLWRPVLSVTGHCAQKDEALWHIKKEFVTDSVWKYYSASSLPYSQEKHKRFPFFSGSSQLVALSVFM